MRLRPWASDEAATAMLDLFQIQFCRALGYSTRTRFMNVKANEFQQIFVVLMLVCDLSQEFLIFFQFRFKYATSPP
jgi:hypothetical protein